MIQQQITPQGKTYTVIHFMFPLNWDAPTEYRIACMPHMTEYHETAHHLSYHRSNAWQATTCAACKRTLEYKRAAGIAVEPPPAPIPEPKPLVKPRRRTSGS